MNLIKHLRQKPQRVRERMVLVAVIVVSPILFIIWSLTAHYRDGANGPTTIDTVRNAITGTFGNPVYQDTFGTPGTPNSTATSASGL